MFLHKHFLAGGRLTELEDIMMNLGFIFSTRRGAGFFLRDFGLSDIGFRTPEEMVVALSSEIRENIRLYEPRVEVMDIDEDWDDSGKRSKLLVRLRLRNRTERLEVVVDLKNKSFDVRPYKSPSAQ